MIILGLNFHFHDSTACILKDGKLITAIEEERLSREKHTCEFPEKSIKRCMEIAGITKNQIDHIAISADFSKHNLKKIIYAMKLKKQIFRFAKQEFLRPYSRNKTFKIWYTNFFTSNKPTVHNIDHHLSHIIGSFYVSPYKEAALLSIDGSGEWSTAWTGVGNNTQYERYSESFFPHSLGSFYEAVTEFCGFRPNYDEGKTMGLAPFGDASVFYDTVKNIISVNDDSILKADLSYFSYQNSGAKRCNKKFYKTFGNPRSYDKNAPFEQYHYDTAAAFQKVLEDIAIKMCNQLQLKSKKDYLVIAGGVSLNSVMNGEILRRTNFKDIYVMPAAGDNGTAIGAAFYLYNYTFNKPRTYIHDNPYVGTEYSDEEIEAHLKKYKLKFIKSDNIYHDTAKELSNGKIIGWFQGKMEIGPRALGARSILANPTYAGMKEKINSEVKYREPYRPFAPSITSEHTKDYFDLDVYAPFMLKVCQVKEEMKSIIPAVTHVDGSARVQTVHKDTNYSYHTLITELGKLTGVPIVLNTSFNIMGEPVVESPTDAIKCFYTTGLDILSIGNYLVYK